MLSSHADCEVTIAPSMSMPVAAVQTWTACSREPSNWTWPLTCSRTESGARSGAALFTCLSQAVALPSHARTSHQALELSRKPCWLKQHV